MQLRGGPVGGLVSVLVLGLVGLTGCAGSATQAPSSGSSSATSSAALRDLGPDPGPAGYRALDVCRIVDLAELQAAYRAAGGTGRISVQSSGPSSCAYGTPAGIWARLGLDDPRDRLPPEVLTTDPGVDQVDESEAGTIIHDPAYVTSHVLSRSGYLLKVSGSGGVADNSRLAKVLTDEVRQGLQGLPPTLALPETSLGRRDICAAVRSVRLAERLGVTSPPEDSVDGRICAYPDRFWVSFFARAAHPGSGQSSPVHIGGVTAELRPQTCEVIIPLRAAPAGAVWEHESLLARPAATGPDCGAFVRALEPLVEELGS